MNKSFIIACFILGVVIGLIIILIVPNKDKELKHLPLLEKTERLEVLYCRDNNSAQFVNRIYHGSFPSFDAIKGCGFLDIESVKLKVESVYNDKKVGWE